MYIKSKIVYTIPTCREGCSDNKFELEKDRNNPEYCHANSHSIFIYYLVYHRNITKIPRINNEIKEVTRKLFNKTKISNFVQLKEICQIEGSPAYYRYFSDALKER